jgi:hypothetical protein
MGLVVSANSMGWKSRDEQSSDAMVAIIDPHLCGVANVAFQRQLGFENYFLLHRYVIEDISRARDVSRRHRARGPALHPVEFRLLALRAHRAGEGGLEDQPCVRAGRKFIPLPEGDP